MKYNFKSLIIVSILLSLLFYGALSYYNYYFDLSKPIISYSGIENNQYYAGNIQLHIQGKDDYKIKHFSIKLDDKIIIDKHPVNSQTIEYPILIPTIHLENGKHTIHIDMTDSARNQNKSNEKIHFTVDNEPLEIISLQNNTDIKINQGNTLHILLQSNKILKKGEAKSLIYTVPLALESNYSTFYELFLPIATDEIPGKNTIKIEAEDFVGNTAFIEIEYEIIPTQFKKQFIKLKNKKNKEELAFYNSSKIDTEIKKATENSPTKKLWHGNFYKPCVNSPITTEFGVIRTSFEKGRYRHDAIDYGALPKSPVWACQDGIIVIKDAASSGFGNCIAIDHGLGLISIYGHLDSFAAVEINQPIKKGTIIGNVGMTGYATGYHLHWEMRLCNVKINPLEWIKNDIN